MSRQASNRMASGSHASSRSLRSVSSTNSPPPPRIAQESPKCLMQSFAEEDSTSCCDQDADGEQTEEWRTAQELKIPDGVVCTLEAMVKAMKENPDKFHTNLSPQMAKLLNGLLRTDSLDEESINVLCMSG
ncbi:hypothetical protein BSKO_11051 [Bryopsis sp. KO-2023]|nr:hypothetical protein BSKO_11051 [Bryopsis sp. KO-2023]